MSFEEKDRNEDLFGFLFENDDYPCEDGELSSFNDMGTSEGKAEEEQDVDETSEYLVDFMQNKKRFTFDDIEKGPAYYHAFIEYVDYRIYDYDEKIEIVNDSMGGLLKEMSMLYKGSTDKEEIEKFTELSDLYDSLGFPFENNREMYSALLKTRGLYPSCWSLDDIVKWIRLNHLYRGFSYFKESLRMDDTMIDEKLMPEQYDCLNDKRLEMVHKLDKWHNLILDNLREFKEKYVVEDDSPAGFSLSTSEIDEINRKGVYDMKKKLEFDKEAEKESRSMEEVSKEKNELDKLEEKFKDLFSEDPISYEQGYEDGYEAGFEKASEEISNENEISDEGCPCEDCDLRDECLRSKDRDDEWCEECDCKDGCAFDCMKGMGEGSSYTSKYLEILEGDYLCDTWEADNFLNANEFSDDNLNKLEGFHEVDKQVFYTMYNLLGSLRDMFWYLKLSMRAKYNIEKEDLGNNAETEFTKWMINRYWGSGDKEMTIPCAYNTMVTLLNELEQVWLNVWEPKVLAEVPEGYNVLDGSETKQPLTEKKMFGYPSYDEDDFGRVMRYIPISAARLDGYMNELGQWIISDGDEESED